MEHGQKINVAFTSSIPRRILVSQDANGQALATPFMDTYYRNNFNHEGKTYSVRSPQDLAGNAGIVMHVKKGQPVPGSTTGQLVAEDAFTLIGVMKSQAVKDAVDTASVKALSKVLENIKFD